MSGGPIRVFLVDDQELVRTGFELILGTTSDLLVVGSAGDAATAIARLSTTAPRADVVLMDIRMPGMDGVTATRHLTALPDPPRVVMLTTFDADDLLVAALRAGAAGYLLKDAGAAELVAAVRAAAAGEAPVSPRLVRHLIDSFLLSAPPEPARRPAHPGLERLTGREREILAAVGLGLTNTEIAVRLSVAESTVKTHLGSVLRKLGIRDRVQAVIVAQTIG
ncbi:response regulator [Actinoplanes derwentensis]|uniref:DNA-binding response regulator, NarL/FixJ family, contains REC and HTH domains n=1 Tax=Actinoplanes derwentensis TaxID=113562 RepID=A0A1H1SZB3_9ACTN|nr:response regulator transcription factor [Actinoplanes derwentensis]GID90454.1 DNA-binding response regulator [Actinoplanes derwentensis]SDS53228.1 DNA-binding response regulator, NarL/FixJ family, contains REC and HTH domains [Actinoplanes derwentensis]